MLCLVTAALWVRSYVVNDQLHRMERFADVHIKLDRGTLVWLNESSRETGAVGTPVVS